MNEVDSIKNKANKIVNFKHKQTLSNSDFKHRQMLTTEITSKKYEGFETKQLAASADLDT